MLIKQNDLRVYITFMSGNIHIKDSYRIQSDEDKKQILHKIMGSHSYVAGHYKRNFKSYLREWKAHNYLYNKNFKREQTASVDLNDNESLFRRFCYFFLSILERRNYKK